MVGGDGRETNGVGPGRRELAIAQMNTRNAFGIADITAGGSVGGTQMGKASEEVAQDVGFHDDE